MDRNNGRGFKETCVTRGPNHFEVGGPLVPKSITPLRQCCVVFRCDESDDTKVWVTLRLVLSSNRHGRNRDNGIG